MLEIIHVMKTQGSLQNYGKFQNWGRGGQTDYGKFHILFLMKASLTYAIKLIYLNIGNGNDDLSWQKS